jgi:hypothetical protein
LNHILTNVIFHSFLDLKEKIESSGKGPNILREHLILKTETMKELLDESIIGEVLTDEAVIRVVWREMKSNLKESKKFIDISYI